MNYIRLYAIFVKETEAAPSVKEFSEFIQVIKSQLDGEEVVSLYGN